MVRIGGRGGETRRLRKRCELCQMLGYHKRAAVGRVLHLCNRHERLGREAGCLTHKDWEAYAIIVKTFGDVEVRPDAFSE